MSKLNVVVAPIGTTMFLYKYLFGWYSYIHPKSYSALVYDKICSKYVYYIYKMCNSCDFILLRCRKSERARKLNI